MLQRVVAGFVGHAITYSGLLKLDGAAVLGSPVLCKNMSKVPGINVTTPSARPCCEPSLALSMGGRVAHAAMLF